MLDSYINDNKEKVYISVDEHGEWILPIKSYMTFCKNVHSLRLNTLNAYCLQINRFYEWLNIQGITLNQVDLNVILKYKAYIKSNSNLKISTINKIMSIISNFIIHYHQFNSTSGMYIQGGIIGSTIKINTHNKLYGIVEAQKSFKNLLMDEPIHSKEKEIITRDEAIRIMEACVNDRDKLLIRILFDTACRIGEVMNLTIECIDIANSQIHIKDIDTEERSYKLKTNSSNRSIPIPVSTLNMIIKYISENSKHTDSNFIFTKIDGANKGKPIDYSVVESLFKRIRKKTGINRLHPHLIRISTASYWRELGMPAKVSHVLLGHKSYRTTNMFYEKITITQKQKAIENIEKRGLLYEYSDV